MLRTRQEKVRARQIALKNTIGSKFTGLSIYQLFMYFIENNGQSVGINQCCVIIILWIENVYNHKELLKIFGKEQTVCQ